MIPRQAKIGLNAICTNPDQKKGLVKLNYGCKFGEKSEQKQRSN